MEHDPHAMDPTADGLDRRSWDRMVLNLVITMVEFVGGMWAGSVALLAYAAHNLADGGALARAIFARRLGWRAPTVRHTYRLKRAEVIAALINSGALIAISVLIGREAVARLFHPEPLQPSIMLLSAVVALIANIVCVFLRRTYSHDNINLKSAFLHWVQDAIGIASGRRGSDFGPHASRRIRGCGRGDSGWLPRSESVQQLAVAASQRCPNVQLHHASTMNYLPQPRATFVLVFAIIALVVTPAIGENLGEQELRIKRIEDAVLAPCCYTEPVSRHQSEVAVKIRLEIAKSVAAGKTDQEILDTYVKQYGSKVLVDPRTLPRLWMQWVPWFVLLLGVAVAVWLLHRWHSRPVPRPTPTHNDPIELPDLDDDSWI